MIYLTQFIFVVEGQEAVFDEFEAIAIPLMESQGGRIIYRIRPDKGSFITANELTPYEIHFMSFESESHLSDFLKDDRRLTFMHLKEASVKSTFLVKGFQI